MTDLQYIPSTESLQNAVKKLKLLNPVKDIALATQTNKGSVSSYLNGGIKPSANFIKKFEEVYNIKIELVQTNYKHSENVSILSEPNEAYGLRKDVLELKKIISEKDKLILAYEKLIETLEEKIQMLEISIGKKNKTA